MNTFLGISRKRERNVLVRVVRGELNAARLPQRVNLPNSGEMRIFR